MSEYSTEVMEKVWFTMIEDVKTGKAHKKIGDIAVIHGELWKEELRGLDSQIIWELYCSIPRDMRSVNIIDQMMYCAMDKYAKKFVGKHGSQPNISIGTVGHALTQLQAESDRLFNDSRNWEEVFRRADAIQLTL